MTRDQRETLLGFLERYDRSAAPLLTIAVPSGSQRACRAVPPRATSPGSAAASGVTQCASSPSLPGTGRRPPLRARGVLLLARAYRHMRRWPRFHEHGRHKHYANFGCSYQNNLAAQVANPADLVGPRKPSEIDAENRGKVIDVYRSRSISDEFLGNSEVSY